MSSKEQFKKTINHQQPDRVVVDFGATPVTGIHVKTIAKLRRHFGLEERPVKVLEPYQMLGEVDEELIDAIGIDVIGAWGRENMFGFFNHAPFKEWETPWGQRVEVPVNFNTKVDNHGDILMFPKGDTSIAPCAKMPKASYFFDALNRQEPIVEEELNVEDNLEEFSLISDDDLEHWRVEVDKRHQTGKAVVAGFGGTALGDIALVPGLNLKTPKGIRDVTEWYMSTIMRPNYIKDIFAHQVEIAKENMRRIFEVVGNKVDAVFVCGTDFGTQDSTFCAPEQFNEMWLPYYREINDWVHQNTEWKTFKHSCGAVESFMDGFIQAGFDIINPVQISAAGMDPAKLKRKYGDNLIFWGGGVDTQQVLPFGKPEEVREQVLKTCDIFMKNGGFVFNSVHNVQAGVPVENFIAMLDAIKEFNGK